MQMISGQTFYKAYNKSMMCATAKIEPETRMKNYTEKIGFNWIDEEPYISEYFSCASYYS